MLYVLYVEGLVLKFRYVVVDFSVCHGKPVFKGTRILVSDVLELLAAGKSVEEILEEYPKLSEEMIKEALMFASMVLRRGGHAIKTSTR
mgnify:CR=1 FL=1